MGTMCNGNYHTHTQHVYGFVVQSDLLLLILWDNLETHLLPTLDRHKLRAGAESENAVWYSVSHHMK